MAGEAGSACCKEVLRAVSSGSADSVVATSLTLVSGVSGLPLVIPPSESEVATLVGAEVMAKLRAPIAGLWVSCVVGAVAAMH